MGLELTTDRYPPITSQTRYPLPHAASSCTYQLLKHVYNLLTGVIVLKTRSFIKVKLRNDTNCIRNNYVLPVVSFLHHRYQARSYLYAKYAKFAPANTLSKKETI